MKTLAKLAAVYAGLSWLLLKAIAWLLGAV